MVFTLSKANLKECPVCESASRTVCFFENHVKKTQKNKKPGISIENKGFS